MTELTQLLQNWLSSREAKKFWLLENHWWKVI